MGGRAHQDAVLLLKGAKVGVSADNTVGGAVPLVVLWL